MHLGQTWVGATVTIYEKVTESILSALDKGVVPWRKPWTGELAAPVNAISQRPYRGVNVFLLSMSRFTDHRWLTRKQVDERRGVVKLGERPTMVIFWKRWEPPRRDVEKAPEQEPHAPLLRCLHVFNVDQCEGLGIPELYRPAAEHEIQRIEKAERLVDCMEDRPRISEGISAWYRPGDDLVQIPAIARFKSADSYYATLFHELGHSTGHPRRLNRRAVSDRVLFASGEYSKEELVAELTSAFCCATVSLDNSLIDDAASYIDGWLRVLRGDPKAMVIAAAQAQRAADFIKSVQYKT